MLGDELPVPAHFDPERVSEVWRVPYEKRAADAESFARVHRLQPSSADSVRVCLVAVDCQNTFCTPGFELFVAGRSGVAAVDDSRRLCEFVYRNLDLITRIVPTLDTHQAMQIFHSVFLVDRDGNHPTPYTVISAEDVERGHWQVSPEVCRALGIDERHARRHLRHYAQTLEAGGKYSLTVWPYHAMLGGIGHALVSSFEEAIFFHAVARQSQPEFRLKGRQPLTEHYSVVGPEVAVGPDGEPLGGRDEALLDELRSFDAVVIAGQAKSHCVAWTIDDLLEAGGDALAAKLYLLEDCTSPVVVPSIVDYTDAADEAVRRFSRAGVHIVRSTDPILDWPTGGNG
jgi:nicotinamidase-related amidase